MITLSSATENSSFPIEYSVNSYTVNFHLKQLVTVFKIVFCHYFSFLQAPPHLVMYEVDTPIAHAAHPQAREFDYSKSSHIPLVISPIDRLIYCLK